MAEELVLRSAVAADIPILRAFEQGILAAERPLDRTLADGPVQIYDLERMVGAENVEMLLACLGGKPIGCGFARIEPAEPYVKHRIRGYLGLMYVAPEHRGQGVNQALVQRLQAWCRSRGVVELRLDVYHANIAAIRAYERAGFQPHLVTMRASLGDTEGSG